MEKQTKKKAGRPKKVINKLQFEKLCSLQCTQPEICNVLDVTDKTLANWCKETYKLDFSDVFKLKRQGGFTSLRRYGYKMAENNPAVWIFHAKNYLGMKDKVEIEDTQINEIEIRILPLEENL